MIGAVIALQEGILHRFHSQIQAPVLTVHGDICIAAQRSRRAKVSHEAIGQIVLHHGGILDEVIQAQLVQTVIAFSVIILVKLDLETVPIAVHGRNRTERGIALGTNTHIAVGLAVDHHRANRILLVLAGLEKAVPVIHNDIDTMDPFGIKEFLLVAHDLLCRPDSQRIGKEHNRAQHKSQNRRHKTDDINMLVC